MRVRFVCEHCQQLLSVGASKIGHQLNCPKCRGAILVPGEDEAAMMLAMRRANLAQEPVDARTEFLVYDDNEETEYVYETETTALARPNHEAGRSSYGRVDLDKLAISRWVVYAQGGLLLTVAMLAFLLGMFAGGGFSSKKPAPPANTGPRACVVQGIVSYENAAGMPTPDTGGVVLVVPTDARPELDDRISPVGLRPSDPPPDENHLGLQALHVLGGAYARVNEQGAFSLQVPDSGSYFFLYLSRHSPRAVGQILPKEDLAEMGRYFLPPADLLGRQKYLWQQRDVAGNTQIEQTFTRQQ